MRGLTVLTKFFAPNKLITKKNFHIFRRYAPFFDIDEHKKYRLMLDVQDFNTNDISVKVEDRKIKISATKSSDYKNWRDMTQIKREYDIPEDVDPATVKSNIDSGVLVIEGDRRITGEAKHVTSDKEFIMNIDLHGFPSDKVNVKISGDELHVKAEQHIENVDNDSSQSKLYRNFYRRFMLPDNVDKVNVSAKFDKDGRLTITAPYTKPPVPSEKEIPVKTESK